MSQIAPNKDAQENYLYKQLRMEKCSSPITFCSRPIEFSKIPMCELSHVPLACARINSRWLAGWSELNNTRFLDFGQVNLIGFAHFHVNII